MADEIKTPESEVVSQEGALVGDENQPEPREVEVYVNEDSVNAQVSPERQAAAAQVPVHEVAVSLDEPILDPSSPLAVQVPDAGRGSTDLPIHGLKGKTVEDVFAESGDDPDAQPEVVKAAEERKANEDNS